MMKKWKWMVIVVAVLSLMALNAGAQDYPKGPINYWVPFPAGGESDIEIRTLQPYLEKSLGVPLVISYVPGAGGALCWSKLAAAKPDGYTIGGVNMPANILQPEFMKGRDLQDKGFRLPHPHRVHAERPGGQKRFQGQHPHGVHRIREGQPGKGQLRRVGRFTGTHMGLLQMMKLAGIKLNYLTFAGNAPLQTALMGGHIDAAFNGSVQLVASKNDVKGPGHRFREEDEPPARCPHVQGERDGLLPADDAGRHRPQGGSPCRSRSGWKRLSRRPLPGRNSGPRWRRPGL